MYCNRCAFGGSKNSNSYVIETPILAIASHQDIMLNSTTSMATISTTMFSSSTSTPIINSQYEKNQYWVDSLLNCGDTVKILKAKRRLREEEKKKKIQVESE